MMAFQSRCTFFFAGFRVNRFVFLMRFSAIFSLFQQHYNGSCVIISGSFSCIKLYDGINKPCRHFPGKFNYWGPVRPCKCCDFNSHFDAIVGAIVRNAEAPRPARSFALRMPIRPFIAIPNFAARFAIRLRSRSAMPTAGWV